MNTLNNALPVLKRARRYVAAALALALGGPVSAQDAPSQALPEAARLALRGKAGDIVKMEGEQKVTTHLHLEALGGEYSTETSLKQQSVLTFRGRGPNGVLQIEEKNTARYAWTNTGGAPTQQGAVRSSGLYTIKPTLEVVKHVAQGAVPKSGAKSGSKGTQVVVSSSSNLVAGIRFPEKVVKAGDTWSGTTVVTEAGDFRGVSLHYTATLAGFEMYQSFPCAHVDVTYTYNGPMPAIEAQIRKRLPAGAKVAGSG